MPFVRISLMKPKQGSEQRAQDLIDQLTRYHEQQAGFLGGYTLCLADGGELGG